MTAKQLRGQSVLGTNTGSFKAKTNTAPGAGAALSMPTAHNAFDDTVEEAMLADEYVARGGSQANRAAAVRDSNLVQLARS